MIWFVIEAGVALLLAAFIVWFTMGGKRNAPPSATSNARDTQPVEKKDSR